MSTTKFNKINEAVSFEDFKKQHEMKVPTEPKMEDNKTFKLPETNELPAGGVKSPSPFSNYKAPEIKGLDYILGAADRQKTKVTDPNLPEDTTTPKQPVVNELPK